MKRFIFLIIILVSFFVIVNQSFAFNGFRLGVQVADNRGDSGFGLVQFTPWVFESPGYNRIHWSDWAMDNNGYDRDAIRIYLGVFSINGELRDTDVRLAIQLSDDAATSEHGIIQFTPWASDGGGLSFWATDKNEYDPDAIRIGVETRYREGFVIHDLRVGIQLSDCGGDCEIGTPRYTRYANQVGGWSEWATDENRIDPDAVLIDLWVDAEETVEGFPPVENNILDWTYIYYLQYFSGLYLY